MPLPPHVAVIDPGVRVPEIDCYNHLLELSTLPLTYHLPALQGLDSLARETETLRGIIIFGSESSVNDRRSWQEPLEAWLMPRLLAKTPAFGCCYGHQMFAYMFGGKVGYRTPDKAKLTGFREVTLVEDELWGSPKKGALYVTHNEVVTEISKDLKIVATSNDVKIDGLRHKALPIWSFQAHPEATRCFAQMDGFSMKNPLPLGDSLLKSFIEFCSQ